MFKRITTFIIILTLIPVRWSFSAVSNNDQISNILQQDFSMRYQTWGIQANQKNGMVYFATNNGLIEFDGLKFNTFPSPGNRALRSICIDTSGIIYTGGFEEFGYWKADNYCNLSYTSLSDSIKMMVNDEIWKIYQSGNDIFFQSFTTIYHFNGSNTKALKAPGNLLFLFQVQDGYVAQVLGNGLYRFNGSDYSFIDGSQIFAGKKVHSIIALGINKFLVCTEKDGIFKYENHRFNYWDCEISRYLTYQTCNAGICTNDTTLVFGTILNGIVEASLDGTINQIQNYASGLNNNTVLCLSKTSDNGVWVGLDEGVNYLNTSSRIKYYSTQSGSLGTIYALLIKDNTLYLGSNHGLFMSTIDQKSANYQFSNLHFIENSQGQVWTLNLVDDQILCGHNDGTFVINGNQLTKISDITGGWSIRPYDDFLLEGTYTGLIILKKDNHNHWVFRNRLEGFYEPSRHIELDYLGNIWVSHPQKGIFKLQTNENRDSIKSTKAYPANKNGQGPIDVFKINNRIVFTSGNGFYTYDYMKDSIILFPQLNHAVGEYQNATQVIAFGKNLYWFVYENKLALFKISIEFEPELVDELLIYDAIPPGRDLVLLPFDPKGYLVSNRNGFAVIDKRKPELLETSSSIFVRQMAFHGKNRSLEFCPLNQPVTSPYFMNNVTILFANPQAVNQGGTNYRYRIKEIDDRWNYTTGPEISYFHLKPGQYHLQISSTGNPTVSETAFIIQPPWYRTFWAYIGYFIVWGILGYSIYLWFRLKLERQRKLLEFEVRQNSLENRLQTTNMELMLTMRYLIQKNETLTLMRDEIDNLKNSEGNYPVKFIKKLDNYLAQGLEMQTKEWQLAMNNLKLSQEGYFRKLKEKYPKLTSNDVRMCSYLRMNFNSKEIAHLLNISTRAVEISRYRLRKKLDLQHDQNLTEFLMQDDF